MKVNEDIQETGRCGSCVTDRSMCDTCIENPRYRNITGSHYAAYIPACPAGYDDCVYDPAHLKAYGPEIYFEAYGDASPEDVVREHGCGDIHTSPDEEYVWCNDYDDECK